MNELVLCPICLADDCRWESPTPEFANLKLKCERCGNFKMSEEVNDDKLGALKDAQRIKVSGWIYEQNRMGVKYPEVTSENLKEILSIRIPPIPERIRRFLKLAVEEGPFYNNHVMWNMPNFISMTYSRDTADVTMLVDYLIDKGFIKRGDFEETVRITTEGYIKNEEWNKSFSESVQGFVALWFDDRMDEVWKNGFQSAIDEAGYEAFKVDMKQHNNKIDDEIIAEIRRSRFLVADFTGHRGGVYFEAGFAKGLGLEVFWTCKETDKKKLHFDIRQFNFIFWKDAKDLKKQLKDRISATINDGPNRP